MPKNVWRGWLGAFVSIFLVIGICQPAFAKVKVKIRRPRKNMAIADYKFRVKGSIKKAPEGMFFWICLQEKGNKQWKPQDGPIKVDEGYFESPAYIMFEGIDERDKPTKINIAVVGVNGAGNEKLKAYVKESFKTDQYPYIDLPEGSEVLKIREIEYQGE